MIPPTVLSIRPPTHLLRSVLEDTSTLLPILQAGFKRLEQAVNPRRVTLEQRMRDNVAKEEELEELDQGVNLSDELVFLSIWRVQHPNLSTPESSGLSRRIFADSRWNTLWSAGKTIKKRPTTY